MVAWKKEMELCFYIYILYAPTHKYVSAVPEHPVVNATGRVFKDWQKTGK